MSPAATLDVLHRRYRSQSSRSHALFEEGRNWTVGVAKGACFYPPYPLAMARSEGCYLWDVDGHRYVDFFNHHTAQILGHNDSTILLSNHNVERES